ncbi:hypothetical protein BV25DRAFT_1920836 [Artomyces pyxidatus]|uniref:Uncharacterized protein n=1 Tax=Artomyces pyxidatus TaxID=48021 RepID=A0ACB8SJ43_9AGAM|nr:hypothetical protein BV25DRAFT_1920836 [Artomyces pyxidatus]
MQLATLLSFLLAAAASPSLAAPVPSRRTHDLPTKVSSRESLVGDADSLFQGFGPLFQDLVQSSGLGEDSISADSSNNFGEHSEGIRDAVSAIVGEQKRSPTPMLYPVVHLAGRAPDSSQASSPAEAKAPVSFSKMKRQGLSYPTPASTPPAPADPIVPAEHTAQPLSPVSLFEKRHTGEGTRSTATGGDVQRDLNGLSGDPRSHTAQSLSLLRRSNGQDDRATRAFSDAFGGSAHAILESTRKGMRIDERNFFDDIMKTVSAFHDDFGHLFSGRRGI